MKNWHGNKLQGYVIAVEETEAESQLPVGPDWVRFSSTQERDEWLAQRIAQSTYGAADYTKVLDARIDAVARDKRYSNMASMRSYAGFPNPYQEECLPYAKWSADVWKQVDLFQQQPPSGPPPTPEQFADLVFQLVPPPSS